ncbi:MAG: hypothetical protein K2X82_30840 [Gemmataceae bacterium]|nr:hypothetical protein [Gemmataceae bacterium]
MIPEPSDPAELLGVVRGWFRLLAAGRWNEACDLLDEADGVRWTPDAIRSALDLAYRPGCRFRAEHPEGPRFTHPDTTNGTLDAEVGDFTDGAGWWVEYDVPLNGSWSELTAHFRFLRRPGGLAVVLHDLHIL